MRAVGFNNFGGPEVVEVREAPEPQPGIGQVLVAVDAAPINPVDVQTRTGKLHEFGFHDAGPGWLGWDVAGTVEAIGPETSRLLLGQRVIGISSKLWGNKTQSELVVLDEPEVVAIPQDLPSRQGSTLPLAGLTALQALEAADLRQRQTLLVTGAGGAVGRLTIQLARMRGLTVLAAARPAHADALANLGAHHFIDTSDLVDGVRGLLPRGVDASIDTAGLGRHSLDTVADRGTHVSLSVLSRPAPLRGIRSVSVAIRAHWEQLAVLALLASSGSLQLEQTRPFAFADAAEAHKVFAQGRQHGERLILHP